MRRFVLLAALLAALSIIAASAALAAPITKQNGSTPLFNSFTSICAVPGYLDYGHCAGTPSTFNTVSGRINAIQAKKGSWNLGFSFSNLQPGASYKLWGNRTGATPSPGEISGFFPIATVTAAPDGSARYSYQTSEVTNLGFDLNLLDNSWDQYGYTIVTSYWSEQTIQVLNPDGTLYIPTT